MSSWRRASASNVETFRCPTVLAKKRDRKAAVRNQGEVSPLKRFLTGAVLGGLTVALLAQRPSDKIVPPQIVVDNQKVKVSRWVLQPGERSPVHTHSLDHVYVVVHGSKIREFISDGAIHDDSQETGRAAFSPARGKTHSFENVGTTPYEMISIELKQ